VSPLVLLLTGNGLFFDSGIGASALTDRFWSKRDKPKGEGFILALSVVYREQVVLIVGLGLPL
jgi:hypothetical protein